MPFYFTVTTAVNNIAVDTTASYVTVTANPVDVILNTNSTIYRWLNYADTYKGIWNQFSSYSKGDFVRHNNAIYLAKQDVAVSNYYPSADEGNWELFLTGQAGDQGPQGPAGADGARGPTGPAGAPGSSYNPESITGTNVKILASNDVFITGTNQVLITSGNGVYFSTPGQTPYEIIDNSGNWVGGITLNGNINPSNVYTSSLVLGGNQVEVTAHVTQTSSTGTYNVAQAGQLGNSLSTKVNIQIYNNDDGESFYISEFVIVRINGANYFTENNILENNGSLGSFSIAEGGTSPILRFTPNTSDNLTVKAAILAM
jgi:hypothetical protein